MAKHKILVPTDFSKCAERATDLAMGLAPVMDADVHLLNKVHIHPFWHFMTEDERKAYPESEFWEEVVQRAFRQLQEKYQEEGKALKLAYASGDLEDLIQKYIRNEEVDLIVMGTHGLTGLKELLVNSHAQKITRVAEVPVIVVKKSVEKIEFKNIIFASDFRDEAMPAFHRLIEFGKFFGSKLHLLNIAAFPKIGQTPEDHQQMAKFALTCRDLMVEMCEKQDVSIEMGITRYAEEIGADMVAIAHFPHGRVYRTLIGSISEALVNHLEIPVMSIAVAEQSLETEEEPIPNQDWNLSWK